MAPPEASIAKLYWATWHRDLGELAMDVIGAGVDWWPRPCPTSSTRLQRIFLFSRADTIYGGSNEIQRNIIGERVLGLPARSGPSVADPSAQVAAPPRRRTHDRDRPTR